jgi:hypothetical protein
MSGPTDALENLYRELGYDVKTDRDKLAQLNRSLRNFLLQQKPLPKDILDYNPSQGRSLAEQFCNKKSGEKTNAEIFWSPHVACRGRQPIWPQDGNEYGHVNFK